MNLLFEAGLVGPLLPELLPMKGLPQGPPAAPTGDLWDHVLRVLELLGEEVSFPLALAALLHDVGKPRTVGRTAERYTFYHHEHVGRGMADQICLRLKLSNAERERVDWLVEKHQFLSDASRMRTSKLKTTLDHPGIRELLALHRADAQASGKNTDHVEFCEALLRQWSPADLNPRAAHHRPRPGRTGFGTGAAIQALAGRGPRGAAGRNDHDTGAGAGNGETAHRGMRTVMPLAVSRRTRNRKRTLSLHQTFQQILQLADFRLHGESRVGDVADIDRQRPIVTETGQLGDDPAVLDFALADPQLELIGAAAGVAQTNVPHEGINLVEIPVLVGPGNVVTWIERQAQAGNAVAQLHGRSGQFRRVFRYVFRWSG